MSVPTQLTVAGISPAPSVRPCCPRSRNRGACPVLPGHQQALCNPHPTIDIHVHVPGTSQLPPLLLPARDVSTGLCYGRSTPSTIFRPSPTHHPFIRSSKWLCSRGCPHSRPTNHLSAHPLSPTSTSASRTTTHHSSNPRSTIFISLPQATQLSAFSSSIPSSLVRYRRNRCTTIGFLAAWHLRAANRPLTTPPLSSGRK